MRVLRFIAALYHLENWWTGCKRKSGLPSLIPHVAPVSSVVVIADNYAQAVNSVVVEVSYRHTYSH